MKDLVAELKNYQAQVHAYKFEIERINARIKKVKDVYFEKRQQELGAIQETEEEAYGDQPPQTYSGQNTGGYQQQMMDDQAFLQQ